MKKKYIKPSIVVEAALLNTLMDTISVPVKGDIDKADDFTVNAKQGTTTWCDEEEE